MPIPTKREMETRLGKPILAVYANDHGWQWFLVEESGAGLFYGFVISPFAPEGEWGSVTASDLNDLGARRVEETKSQSRCLKGICKKCNATIYIEIGDLTVEQAKERLARIRSFECPGRHVELSSVLENYLWRPEPVMREMPTPESDKDFLEKLKTQNPHRRIFLMGEPIEDVPSLQSIPGLRHVGYGEFQNDTHRYVRYDSPTRSRRFYIEEPRAILG